MGVVTTIAAFYFLRKDIKSKEVSFEYNIHLEEENKENKMLIPSKKLRRALALLILVLCFLVMLVIRLVILMIILKVI